MQTQFDKIYVVSLITNKTRQEFVKQQMAELGLEFEFIYGIDFTSFKHDALGVDMPIPYLFNKFIKNCKIETTMSDYGCTISHYDTVLHAYEFEYKNVLIIEDDICFLKDKALIENMFNSIPEDADFVTWDPRFLYWIDDIEFRRVHEELKNATTNYIPLDNSYGNLCGTLMYALMNRKTMEIYLSNQRNRMHMCDHVLDIFRCPTVNRYICSKCLAIDQLCYSKNFKAHNQCYVNNYNYIDPENVTIDKFNAPKEWLLSNRLTDEQLKETNFKKGI